MLSSVSQYLEPVIKHSPSFLTYYIKTGFTSVFYSLTLVRRLMLLLLQIFFNLKNTPLASTTLLWMSPVPPPSNCDSFDLFFFSQKFIPSCIIVGTLNISPPSHNVNDLSLSHLHHLSMLNETGFAMTLNQASHKTLKVRKLGGSSVRCPFGVPYLQEIDKKLRVSQPFF